MVSLWRIVIFEKSLFKCSKINLNLDLRIEAQSSTIIKET